MVSSELEEQALREQEMRRIATALHDLCQPLTLLQCRLEMAGLIGTAEAYREAVEAGLVECARVSEAVASMRKIMWDVSQWTGLVGSGVAQ